MARRSQAAAKAPVAGGTLDLRKIDSFLLKPEARATMLMLGNSRVLEWSRTLFDMSGPQPETRVGRERNFFYFSRV
jgi:hypothetical protein